MPRCGSSLAGVVAGAEKSGAVLDEARAPEPRQARSQGMAWGGNATPGAREYQLFATSGIFFSNFLNGLFRRFHWIVMTI